MELILRVETGEEAEVEHEAGTDIETGVEAHMG